MAESGWRPRLRWTTALPGLLPSTAVGRSEQQPFSLVAPFLRVALGISLTTGFGLGAALAISAALGVPMGTRWETLVQAHGHAQLFGFVGLFILAIGLHFLPRLRGAPLATPGLARRGLVAFSIGAALQPLAQVLAVVTPPPAAAPTRIGVALGGLFAWLGATLVIASLVQTLRQGPPLGWRGGLTAILPFLACGFVTLWAALLANAVLSVLAAVSPSATLPAVAGDVVVDALLLGFALPIAIAVSARLLPIYFGVEVVTPRPLLAVFTGLSLGMLLRLAGDVTGAPPVLGAGNALVGLACLVFPLTSGVPVGVRRAIRRSDPAALARAARVPNLLLRSAYAWLLVSGALLLIDGVLCLVTGAPRLPADGVRHALSAGYLTLLIFGAGARLLPGFARRRLEPVPLLSGVLIAANLAALLRVVPSLAGAAGLRGPMLSGAFGLAGIWALVAVGLFTRYAWPMLTGRRKMGATPA